MTTDTHKIETHNQESHKLIKKQGYRLTPQRQMILDALQESDGHCTPEEVYARVQRKSSAVNRTTVYRTLDFLVRLGLVSTAHMQGNQVIYELASAEPHHHLVCQQCNQITQIDHELVASLFAILEQQKGFKINTDHLVLFGICTQCQAQQQAGETG